MPNEDYCNEKYKYYRLVSNVVISVVVFLLITMLVSIVVHFFGVVFGNNIFNVVGVFGIIVVLTLGVHVLIAINYDFFSYHKKLLDYFNELCIEDNKMGLSGYDFSRLNLFLASFMVKDEDLNKFETLVLAENNYFGVYTMKDLLKSVKEKCVKNDDVAMFLLKTINRLPY